MLDYSYKNLLERHGKTKVAVKDKNKFTDLQDYKAAMELADVDQLQGCAGAG